MKFEEYIQAIADIETEETAENLRNQMTDDDEISLEEFVALDDRITARLEDLGIELVAPLVEEEYCFDSLTGSEMLARAGYQQIENFSTTTEFHKPSPDQVAEHRICLKIGSDGSCHKWSCGNRAGLTAEEIHALHYWLLAHSF